MAAAPPCTRLFASATPRTTARGIKSRTRPSAATSLSFSTSCRSCSSSPSSPIASTSTSTPPPAPFPATPSSTSSSSSTFSAGSTLYAPPLDAQLARIGTLLSPLNLASPLDPLLLQRALTHKSGQHKPSSHSSLSASQIGHGEKLAFLGRRVLRMHYTLHLASHLDPRSEVMHDGLRQSAIDIRFDTKQLGATIGKGWGLQSVLRWREVRGPKGDPTGLYKARGQAVEALIGAVYTQFGIQATKKMFALMVWPGLGMSSSVRQALEGGPGAQA
ncbi:BQ5605_C030g10797 [Microbotryum silenes-dioicae]|uniref:BQ5605_C030g10797 protein n=1 Tax=Microbotryum silenes-dioicae TaxID=796604 RepID=A0A2X0MLQ4_9BASI|nr:BQ5605_C030g10797 [Microbotryum silenes-dioicae]